MINKNSLSNMNSEIINKNSYDKDNYSSNNFNNTSKIDKNNSDLKNIDNLQYTNKLLSVSQSFLNKIKTKDSINHILRIITDISIKSVEIAEFKKIYKINQNKYEQRIVKKEINYCSTDYLFSMNDSKLLNYMYEFSFTSTNFKLIIMFNVNGDFCLCDFTTKETHLFSLWLPYEKYIPIQEYVYNQVDDDLILLLCGNKLTKFSLSFYLKKTNLYKSLNVFNINTKTHNNIIYNSRSNIYDFNHYICNTKNNLPINYNTKLHKVLNYNIVEKDELILNLSNISNKILVFDLKNLMVTKQLVIDNYDIMTVLRDKFVSNISSLLKIFLYEIQYSEEDYFGLLENINLFMESSNNYKSEQFANCIINFIKKNIKNKKSYYISLERQNIENFIQSANYFDLKYLAKLIHLIISTFYEISESNNKSIIKNTCYSIYDIIIKCLKLNIDLECLIKTKDKFNNNFISYIELFSLLSMLPLGLKNQEIISVCSSLNIDENNYFFYSYIFNNNIKYDLIKIFIISSKSKNSNYYKGLFKYNNKEIYAKINNNYKNNALQSLDTCNENNNNNLYSNTSPTKFYKFKSKLLYQHKLNVSSITNTNKTFYNISNFKSIKNLTSNDTTKISCNDLNDIYKFNCLNNIYSLPNEITEHSCSNNSSLIYLKSNTNEVIKNLINCNFMKSNYLESLIYISSVNIVFLNLVYNNKIIPFLIVCKLKDLNINNLNNKYKLECFSIIPTYSSKNSTLLLFDSNNKTVLFSRCLSNKTEDINYIKYSINSLNVNVADTKEIFFKNYFNDLVQLKDKNCNYNSLLERYDIIIIDIFKDIIDKCQYSYIWCNDSCNKYVNVSNEEILNARILENTKLLYIKTKNCVRIYNFRISPIKLTYSFGNNQTNNFFSKINNNYNIFDKICKDICEYPEEYVGDKALKQVISLEIYKNTLQSNVSISNAICSSTLVSFLGINSYINNILDQSILKCDTIDDIKILLKENNVLDDSIKTITNYIYNVKYFPCDYITFLTINKSNIHINIISISNIYIDVKASSYNSILLDNNLKQRIFEKAQTNKQYIFYTNKSFIKDALNLLPLKLLNNRFRLKDTFEELINYKNLDRAILFDNCNKLIIKNSNLNIDDLSIDIPIMEIYKNYNLINKNYNSSINEKTNNLAIKDLKFLLNLTCLSFVNNNVYNNNNNNNELCYNNYISSNVYINNTVNIENTYFQLKNNNYTTNVDTFEKIILSFFYVTGLNVNSLFYNNNKVYNKTDFVKILQDKLLNISIPYLSNTNNEIVNYFNNDINTIYNENFDKNNEYSNFTKFLNSSLPNIVDYNFIKNILCKASDKFYIKYGFIEKFSSNYINNKKYNSDKLSEKANNIKEKHNKFNVNNNFKENNSANTSINNLTTLIEKYKNITPKDEFVIKILKYLSNKCISPQDFFTSLTDKRKNILNYQEFKTGIKKVINIIEDIEINYALKELDINNTGDISDDEFIIFINETNINLISEINHNYQDCLAITSNVKFNLDSLDFCSYNANVFKAIDNEINKIYSDINFDEYLPKLSVISHKIIKFFLDNNYRLESTFKIIDSNNLELIFKDHFIKSLCSFLSFQEAELIFNYIDKKNKKGYIYEYEYYESITFLKSQIISPLKNIDKNELFNNKVIDLKYFENYISINNVFSILNNFFKILVIYYNNIDNTLINNNNSNLNNESIFNILLCNNKEFVSIYNFFYLIKQKLNIIKDFEFLVILKYLSKNNIIIYKNQFDIKVINIIQEYIKIDQNEINENYEKNTRLSNLDTNNFNSNIKELDFNENNDMILRYDNLYHLLRSIKDSIRIKGYKADEIFAKLDSNNKGFITFYDIISNISKVLDIQLTINQYFTLFAFLDKNNDGIIVYDDIIYFFSLSDFSNLLFDFRCIKYKDLINLIQEGFVKILTSINNIFFKNIQSIDDFTKFIKESVIIPSFDIYNNKLYNNDKNKLYNKLDSKIYEISKYRLNNSYFQSLLDLHPFNNNTLTLREFSLFLYRIGINSFLFLDYDNLNEIIDNDLIEILFNFKDCYSIMYSEKSFNYKYENYLEYFLAYDTNIDGFFNYNELKNVLINLVNKSFKIIDNKDQSFKNINTFIYLNQRKERLINSLLTRILKIFNNNNANLKINNCIVDIKLLSSLFYYFTVVINNKKIKKDINVDLYIFNNIFVNSVCSYSKFDSLLDNILYNIIDDYVYLSQKKSIKGLENLSKYLNCNDLILNLNNLKSLTETLLFKLINNQLSIINKTGKSKCIIDNNYLKGIKEKNICLSKIKVSNIKIDIINEDEYIGKDYIQSICEIVGYFSFRYNKYIQMYKFSKNNLINLISSDNLSLFQHICQSTKINYYLNYQLLKECNNNDKIENSFDKKHPFNASFNNTDIEVKSNKEEEQSLKYFFSSYGENYKEIVNEGVKDTEYYIFNEIIDNNEFISLGDVIESNGGMIYRNDLYESGLIFNLISFWGKQILNIFVALNSKGICLKYIKLRDFYISKSGEIIKLRPILHYSLCSNTYLSNEYDSNTLDKDTKFIYSGPDLDKILMFYPEVLNKNIDLLYGYFNYNQEEIEYNEFNQENSENIKNIFLQDKKYLYDSMVSPEFILNPDKNRYDIKIDTWLFGSIMFNILFGEEPPSVLKEIKNWINEHTNMNFNNIEFPYNIINKSFVYQPFKCLYNFENRNSTSTHLFERSVQNNKDIFLCNKTTNKSDTNSNNIDKSNEKYNNISKLIECLSNNSLSTLIKNNCDKQHISNLNEIINKISSCLSIDPKERPYLSELADSNVFLCDYYDIHLISKVFPSVIDYYSPYQILNKIYLPLRHICGKILCYNNFGNTNCGNKYNILNFENILIDIINKTSYYFFNSNFNKQNENTLDTNILNNNINNSYNNKNSEIVKYIIENKIIDMLIFLTLRHFNAKKDIIQNYRSSNSFEKYCNNYKLTNCNYDSLLTPLIKFIENCLKQMINKNHSVTNYIQEVLEWVLKLYIGEDYNFSSIRINLNTYLKNVPLNFDKDTHKEENDTYKLKYLKFLEFKTFMRKFKDISKGFKEDKADYNWSIIQSNKIYNMNNDYWSLELSKYVSKLYLLAFTESGYGSYTLPLIKEFLKTKYSTNINENSYLNNKKKYLNIYKDIIIENNVIDLESDKLYYVSNDFDILSLDYVTELFSLNNCKINLYLNNNDGISSKKSAMSYICNIIKSRNNEKIKAVIDSKICFYITKYLYCKHSALKHECIAIFKEVSKLLIDNDEIIWLFDNTYELLLNNISTSNFSSIDLDTSGMSNPVIDKNYINKINSYNGHNKLNHLVDKSKHYQKTTKLSVIDFIKNNFNSNSNVYEFVSESLSCSKKNSPIIYLNNIAKCLIQPIYLKPIVSFLKEKSCSNNTKYFCLEIILNVMLSNDSNIIYTLNSPLCNIYEVIIILLNKNLSINDSNKFNSDCYEIYDNKQIKTNNVIINENNKNNTSNNNINTNNISNIKNRRNNQINLSNFKLNINTDLDFNKLLKNIVYSIVKIENPIIKENVKKSRIMSQYLKENNISCNRKYKIEDIYKIIFETVTSNNIDKLITNNEFYCLDQIEKNITVKKLINNNILENIIKWENDIEDKITSIKGWIQHNYCYYNNKEIINYFKSKLNIIINYYLFVFEILWNFGLTNTLANKILYNLIKLFNWINHKNLLNIIFKTNNSSLLIKSIMLKITNFYDNISEITSYFGNIEKISNNINNAHKVTRKNNDFKYITSYYRIYHYISISLLYILLSKLKLNVVNDIKCLEMSNFGQHLAKLFYSQYNYILKAIELKSSDSFILTVSLI